MKTANMGGMLVGGRQLCDTICAFAFKTNGCTDPGTMSAARVLACGIIRLGPNLRGHMLTKSPVFGGKFGSQF